MAEEITIFDNLKMTSEDTAVAEEMIERMKEVAYFQVPGTVPARVDGEEDGELDTFYRIPFSLIESLYCIGYIDGLKKDKPSEEVIKAHQRVLDAVMRMVINQYLAEAEKHPIDREVYLPGTNMPSCYCIPFEKDAVCAYRNGMAYRDHITFSRKRDTEEI